MTAWGPGTEATLGAASATPCWANCLMTPSTPEQFPIQIYLCKYLYRPQTLRDASAPLTAQNPDSEG